MTELVKLRRPLSPCKLLNDDLAPTSAQQRTWNMWHVASLWVGMSVCIPTYMLAASMIGAGMTWWQSLLAIFLGNAIVLVPMVVNAHAGTRYGIPFPVYARASFGTVGAQIPSLLRAVVACGWFGIQTWIGGLAINALLGMLWSGWAEIGGGWSFMGYGMSHYASFLLFWGINLYFVWAGTETIKWMETVAAPFLIAMGLALFGWAVVRVGGVGEMLAGSSALTQGREALPFTPFMLMLFSFIGVAVTSATVMLYGEAIWNPVDLVSRIIAEGGSAVLGVVAMAAIVIATLSTNIAANVVAQANSFSNLNPRRISFRVGGLMAGVIGIAIFPWRLLDLYQTWLISYSGLLGAVAGVIVCDYAVIRRGVLDLEELYADKGGYSYSGGINHKAVWALAAGIAVALVGTLDPRLAFLFNGAWFSAAGVSFAVYYWLMRGVPILGVPTAEPEAA